MHYIHVKPALIISLAIEPCTVHQYCTLKLDRPAMHCLIRIWLDLAVCVGV